MVENNQILSIHHNRKIEWVPVFEGMY